MRQRKKQPKYKSKLEQQVALKLGDKVQYEQRKIKFVQPSKNRVYIPDFNTKNKNKVIEVKGRLKPEDRKKHLWVKEQHPNLKVYFIFGRPQNKLYKASPTTYGDWATANGFEWIAASDPIPEHWLK